MAGIVCSLSLQGSSLRRLIYGTSPQWALKAKLRRMWFLEQSIHALANSRSPLSEVPIGWTAQGSFHWNFGKQLSQRFVSSAKVKPCAQLSFFLCVYPSSEALLSVAFSLGQGFRQPLPSTPQPHQREIF